MTLTIGKRDFSKLAKGNVKLTFSG